MSHPFVWFDHRSDDPTGAGAFYEQLLGWTRASHSPCLLYTSPSPRDP